MKRYVFAFVVAALAAPAWADDPHKVRVVEVPIMVPVDRPVYITDHDDRDAVRGAALGAVITWAVMRHMKKRHDRLHHPKPCACNR
ncbi:MAG: hypothetical protein ACO22A_08045 [Schleiferiaceae bacterium]